MKIKLVTAGAAALRRLLKGEDPEYRLEWIPSAAADQQRTGNAPEARHPMMTMPREEFFAMDPIARRRAIQEMLGSNEEL